VISTHVLDTAAGTPACGLPVTLEGEGVVRHAVTDEDGRVASFGIVNAGAYRLTFDTTGHSEFFPRVSVDFTVGDERLHVPLLLSPFGYSTYRGS
jgi:5-hydroxyisourate hydrolase